MSTAPSRRCSQARCCLIAVALAVLLGGLSELASFHGLNNHGVLVRAPIPVISSTLQSEPPEYIESIIARVNEEKRDYLESSPASPLKQEGKVDTEQVYKDVTAPTKASHSDAAEKPAPTKQAPAPHGGSSTDFDPHASLLTGKCKKRSIHRQPVEWTKSQCHAGAKPDAKYNVMDPEETFKLLRTGASIFRFGDGELRLMMGVQDINHGMEKNSKLLQSLLQAAAALGGQPHSGGACVGLVPMMDGDLKRFRSDSKVLSWVSGKAGNKYQGEIRKCFAPGVYCSASITRPDHLADWDHDRLIAGWASVFAGKNVLYIRPSGANKEIGNNDPSKTNLFSKAQSVLVPDFIDRGSRSFALREMILKRIHEELRKARIDIVVLSLGPTATILAAELACQGVQAVDFGSLSGKPHGEKSR